jgi:glycine cleavage system H lipoate-binding protein
MGEVKELKNRQKVHVFSLEDGQCIWMKAGVVNFKLCDHAYDCLSCPFDKAMAQAVEKRPEKLASWREQYLQKPYSQKECRHMLTGRVQFRLCGNAYECHSCEFDQSLEQQQAEMASMPSASTRIVSGFRVADGYYYHRGHSWARLEHGGLVRIGVDDFTQRLLGYLSEVRLPKLGAHVEQTEQGWSLRREDKIARMLAPMEGIVVARNHKALADPTVIKEDPHGDGWLLLVEPTHLKRNLTNLLFADEATAWLKSEADKLQSMVMADHPVPLAATGGEVVDDIYGSVKGLNWDDLVHDFLLT